MGIFRPGKPHWVGFLTVNQAAPTTPTTVSFDDVEVEGDFQLGTDSTGPVVDRPGLYLVTFGIGHTAGTGAQTAAAQLVVGGTVRAHSWSDSSASVRATSGAWTSNLGAGQSVRLQAIGALTGGKLVAAGVTHLSVVRIGPVRWT